MEISLYSLREKKDIEIKEKILNRPRSESEKGLSVYISIEAFRLVPLSPLETNILLR